MNGLPDFPRTEVWHPLVVHFPLAILLLAVVLFLAGIIFRRVFIENTGRLLFVLGTIGGWLAIITGTLADAVVSREICDPTVLETHETNAYITAALFSLISVVVILDYFGFLNRIKKLSLILLIGLSLAGTAFLTYTGHLGAKLVYQQAAGVYTPSEDCREFSK